METMNLSPSLEPSMEETCNVKVLFENALRQLDWDALENLVQQHGTENLHLRMFNQGTETILHRLVHRRVFFRDRSLKIQRLLGWDATLAQDPLVQDEFPIHRAAGDHISMETLQKIYKAFPQGTMRQNANGLTPLHCVITEKRSPCREAFEFLLGVEPKAAAVQCNVGNLLLHFCAEKSWSVELVYKVYQAYPEAVRHKNMAGKLPLDIAMQQKPVNKQLARALVSFYDPEPGKERWLYTTQASHWVKQNYSQAIRSKWLNMEDKGEAFETKSSSPSASASVTLPAKKRKRGTSVILTRSMTRKKHAFLAEEVIMLSLDWLSGPADLAAVSRTSKFLNKQVSTLTTAWINVFTDLDNEFKRHKEEIVTEDFPQEFIDPRHRSGFQSLPPYQKAMRLGQYKAMLFDYLLSSTVGGDSDFLDVVLEISSCILQRADESIDPVDEDLRDYMTSFENVYNQTLCFVFGSFVHNGLSGWSLELVIGGWRDIHPERKSWKVLDNMLFDFFHR